MVLWCFQTPPALETCSHIFQENMEYHQWPFKSWSYQYVCWMWTPCQVLRIESANWRRGDSTTLVFLKCRYMIISWLRSLSTQATVLCTCVNRHCIQMLVEDLKRDAFKLSYCSSPAKIRKLHDGFVEVNGCIDMFWSTPPVLAVVRALGGNESDFQNKSFPGLWQNKHY